MVIYGINPVLEALRAGRATALLVSSRQDERVQAAVALAVKHHVPIRRMSPDELGREARSPHHQGLVAHVRDTPAPKTFEAFLASVRTPALMVVLDGVEDPHNVGAILRSVDAAGADGVVRQSRHAASLGGAAAKASAGAVAHVRVAEVVNIARALETLKEAGVWTVGLTGDAAKPYDDLDYTLPTAFVVGGEGHGLRRLVRDRCDWLVSIPMGGQVESLNVSVATAVALFEAVRQRRAASRGAKPR